MAGAFDSRLVRVGLTVGGQTTYYEDLAIRASGRKYASSMQGDCTVVLYNLSAEMRNRIITSASPIQLPATKREWALLTLDIGRVSTGYWRLYAGDVFACAATQPPDIGVVFNSTTSGALMNTVLGDTSTRLITLRELAEKAATICKKRLVFYADSNRTVENYMLSGSAYQIVRDIERVGAVVCFIDGDDLVVLDSASARNQARADNGSLYILSQENGMVGIPQVSEFGVVVKCMATNEINIGDKITLKSLLLPSVNGDYFVQQITYDIANREEPFYYMLVLTVSQFAML